MNVQHLQPHLPRLADPEIFSSAVERAHRLRAQAMIEIWQALFVANVTPGRGSSTPPRDVHAHLPPTG